MGGTGWSAIRKHLFMEELYRADAPDFFWQGLHMLAPVLIAFGSQEQKQRFLPRILTGEDCWCQGFSEPNAGSDLATLRTTAIPGGDDYVVNGQKNLDQRRRQTRIGDSFSYAPMRRLKPQRDSRS